MPLLLLLRLLLLLAACSCGVANSRSRNTHWTDDVAQRGGRAESLRKYENEADCFSTRTNTMWTFPYTCSPQRDGTQPHRKGASSATLNAQITAAANGRDPHMPCNVPKPRLLAPQPKARVTILGRRRTACPPAEKVNFLHRHILRQRRAVRLDLQDSFGFSKTPRETGSPVRHRTSYGNLPRPRTRSCQGATTHQPSASRREK